MILKNSSRGLLQEKGKILFIKYKIEGEIFYSLPGGTVEIGEDLKACVVREFLEETGINVNVESLILLNEFIDPKPMFVAESWKNGIHQIEAIFKVKREINQPIKEAFKNYDFGMLGTKWLEKQELKAVKYYPEMPIEWFYSEEKNIEIYKMKKR